VDGVTVEYRDASGTIRGAQARVIDFDDPAGNDWLAVNQFTVVESKHTRRPDVVLFVNGCHWLSSNSRTPLAIAASVSCGTRKGQERA
jgi:type I restriction enzyme R subunit